MVVAKVKILVSGLVQGVFFRANTAKVARNLSLTGWVKNLPDGQVEIFAEGEKENLEKLVSWCHQGPPSAQVENLETHFLEGEKEFDSFEIAYQ